MEASQLLNILYGPNSTAEERKNAENALVVYQKSTQALENVHILLNGNFNSQFFGIMTIQVHLMTTDYTPSFNDILSIYTIIKTSPQFVISKFALTVATIGLKSNPDNFLESVFNVTHSESLTLIVATDLVNESEKIYHNRLKNHSIIFCKSNAPFIINLIEHCIKENKHALEATQCFIAWLERLEETQIQLIYNLLLQLLINKQMLEEVSEALCGIVSTMSRFENSICSSLLPAFCNEHLLSLIRDPTDELTYYIKLLMSIGEEMTDYLVVNINKDPSVIVYFKCLLNITNMPGTFPIDEEYSEEPLYIWTYVQESVVEPSNQLCKLIALDFPNYDPSQFELPLAIYTKFEEIYQSLLPIILRKMSVDPQLFKNLPKDTLNTFFVYRSSLCDCVMDIYKISSTFTIKTLIDLLKNLVFKQTSKQQDLESVLRSIAHLSDFCEDDPAILHLFDPLILKQSMQLAVQQIWIPVHLQFLNCIKRYAVWFEKNKQSPKDVIEYAMNLLQHPQLQNAAVLAIKELCSSLPSHMIDYSGSLLSAMQVVKLDAQIGILQSLASTTDALENKDKFNALGLLLSHVLTGLNSKQNELKWINCLDMMTRSFPIGSDLSNDNECLNFLTLLDKCLTSLMMILSQFPTDIDMCHKFNKLMGPLCLLLCHEHSNSISINNLNVFIVQWWHAAPCSECIDILQKLMKASEHKVDLVLKQHTLNALASLLTDSSKMSNL